MYDRDNSSSLSTLELRAALHAAGYRLNFHVLNALVLRYGNRQGTLGFDDFIMCAIKMKSMIGKYYFTTRNWIVEKNSKLNLIHLQRPSKKKILTIQSEQLSHWTNGSTRLSTLRHPNFHIWSISLCILLSRNISLHRAYSLGTSIQLHARFVLLHAHTPQ